MTVPLPATLGQSAGPPSALPRSRAVGGNRGRNGGFVGSGGARTGFVATTHGALLATLLVGLGPAGCQSFVASAPTVGGAFAAPPFSGAGGNSAPGGSVAAARTRVACRLGAAGDDEFDRAASQSSGGGVRGWGSLQAARRKSSHLQVRERCIWGGGGLGGSLSALTFGPRPISSTPSVRSLVLFIFTATAADFILARLF